MYFTLLNLLYVFRGAPQLSSTGKLLEIRDKNDNTLTYTYTSNKLTSVSDTSGLSITFSYNNGLINTITDPINRLVSYSYDGNQNLIEVTDPKSAITEYDYDGAHRLVTLEDRIDTTLSFTYLLGGGPGLDRIHEVYRSDGVDSFKMYTFTYYAARTVVDNARDYSTDIQYNGYGNPTHLDGPSVGTRLNSGDMEWDNGRITSFTDLREYTTTYQYNGHGNKISETDPFANTHYWEYTVIDNPDRYNSLNTQETNKLNKVWTYDYDTSGNLIRITDPTLYIRTMVYSTSGLMVEDSGPPHVTLQYDAHGNLERKTYDDDTYVEHTYNDIGWRTSTKDEDGYTTDYEYDDYGNLITITDPLFNTITYQYDGENRRTSYIDKLDHTTTYTYDPLMCEVSSIGDPLGYIETYVYDQVGNLIEKINKRGISTDYLYDNLNRRIEERDSSGYSMTWEYDAVGNVISETDKVGATTQFTYDELNRRTQVRDPLNYITTFQYDAEGQLISETDARSHTTTYEYDGAGRVIKITDPMNNIETKEYDEQGRLAQETAKDGTTISYTYDMKNKIATITDVTGTTQYTYDGRGNSLTETDPLGRTTTFEYDELSRRVSVETPMQFTTSYNYDAMGRVIEIIDANGHSITYTYDALGRKLSETTELEKVTSYAYDGVGNIVSRIDANNDDTTYDYDDLNRRMSVNYPDSTSITYAYDPMGRVTESHNNGIGLDDDLYFTYDLKGQLISLQALVGAFDLQIDYDYDAVGNKIAVHDPTGGTTTYIYDELDRVIGMNNPYDEITTFEYDSMDRLTRMTYANGMQLINTYNDNGWLVNQEYNSLPLVEISYTYDDVGKLIQKGDANGITTYEYDDDDRLTGVSYLWDDDVTYTYDGVGNRLEMVVKATSGGPPTYTTTYTYNDDNQLLSISDGKTYTYDNNGNVISKTKGLETTDYSYDYENRLMGIEFPDQTTADYIYCSCPILACCNSGSCGKSASNTDVGGKRFAKITADGTTYYFYDGEDIILEFDGNGVLQAQYTHGPGIDNPISMRRNDQSYYYIKGHLDSIIAITNQNRFQIQSYTYDAWGTIVTQIGVLTNPYTYTGREYDPESGLYYYRARYYDSVIGRFMQKDPEGAIDGPNLYVYVRNDPLNKVDPSGKYWIIAGIIIAGCVASKLYYGFKKANEGTWNDKRAHCWVSCSLVKDCWLPRFAAFALVSAKELLDWLREKGLPIPGGATGWSWDDIYANYIGAYVCSTKIYWRTVWWFIKVPYRDCNKCCKSYY